MRVRARVRDRKNESACWGERERERERAHTTEKERGHSVFYNLISEVTYHPFCHILSVTQTNSGT